MNGEIGFTGTLSGSIDAGGGGTGTSNYNELTNKPSINGVTLSGNKTSSQLQIFDGNYNNTTNKPSINGTTLQGDNTTETLGLFDGAYSSLTGKPVLAAVATSGSYNDLNNKPTIPSAQINSDWDADSGVAAILNKPSLATVATTGSYNDLSNRPTIPAAQVNSDWDAESGVAAILNKPTIPAAQVNSDWNSDTGVSRILNKPTLAAVATSGDYSDLNNTPTIPDSADEIEYDPTESGMAATDVQAAIDEMADEVSDINSSLTQLQYAIVSGTLDANNTGATGLDYPTGFTKSNTMVVAMEVYYGDSWRNGVGVSVTNNIPDRFFTYMDNSKIYVYNGSNNLKGCAVRLLIKKVV